MKVLSVHIRQVPRFTSLSKGGNARSQMLKKVMPKLSGERGKKLEQAFANKDKEEIFKIMTQITKELSA